MPPLTDLATDLCAFEHRGACSDAERRAALWLHDELRERGHEAWVETVWVRPAWAWSLFWHALLGATGGVVAATSGAPVVGVVLCAVALVSFLVGRTGRDALLDRLMVRRATQVVVVEPAEPDAPVAVWLHAATDAPRGGAVFGLRRLGARLRPGPFGWVTLALLVATVAAALQVARVVPGVLDVVTFAAVLVLLVATAAGVDAALATAGPGAGEAAGVAAAIAAFEALRADPAPATSAGLVLGGAGELAPLGLRAWLAASRPEPARTLVVDVGPAGAGEALAWTARRPQLRAALATVGGLVAPQGAQDGSHPLRRRRINRPAAANDRRVPAFNVRATDRHGVPPRARGRRDVPERLEVGAAAAVRDAAVAAVRALDVQPDRSPAKATNQS